MIDRKLKTSIILKTLTEIQSNYDEDSLEYLVLHKAKDLFTTMNNLRGRIGRTADIHKPFGN